MDNLAELIAHPEMMPRLLVTRGTLSAAARGCRVLVAEGRYQQVVHPRRYLLWGAVAACLGGLAWGFRRMARLEIHRSRYRLPKQKLPASTPAAVAYGYGGLPLSRLLDPFRHALRPIKALRRERAERSQPFRLASAAASRLTAKWGSPATTART
jgi:hypothetical protein